ncbi:MAG: hypothetical protein ABSB14_11630 [Candidatus Sulfotelmatobacter sp.]|jgi:hypothetical protein
MTSTGVAPAKVNVTTNSGPAAPPKDTEVRGYWIAFALALCVGVAAVAWSSSQAPQDSSASTQQISAAFRDGLYSGRLDAQRGVAPHVSTGRWSAQADRESFAAGYKKGFGKSVATQPEPTEPAPHFD